MNAGARRTRLRWSLVGVAAWAALLIAGAFVSVVDVRADEASPAAAGADGAGGGALLAQLERGQAVYAFSCTTCHGATGQGFEEARSAFPPDHYQCIRCHAPRNPPVMTQRQIDQTQSVFSLGDAPPLADPAALARYGTAQGLYGYVRATMPRWDPGRLDDDAYLDVTAFVLHLAGLLDEAGEPLTFEGLAGVRLVGSPGR